MPTPPLQQYLDALDPVDVALRDRLRQDYAAELELPTLDDTNGFVGSAVYRLARALGNEVADALGPNPFATSRARLVYVLADELATAGRAAERLTSRLGQVEDDLATRYQAACGVALARGALGAPLVLLARSLSILAASQGSDALIETLVLSAAADIARSGNATAAAHANVGAFLAAWEAADDRIGRLTDLEIGNYGEKEESSDYGGVFRSLDAHFDVIVEDAWSHISSDDGSGLDFDAPISASDAASLEPRLLSPNMTLRAYCRAIWEEMCSGRRAVNVVTLHESELDVFDERTRRGMADLAKRHGVDAAGPWVVLDAPYVFLDIEEDGCAGIAVLTHQEVTTDAVGWRAER